MNMVRESEKWVKEVHENAPHLIRTGYWVKKIDPRASEAAVIAGVLHDIERAFPKGRKPPAAENSDWDNKTYNLWHGRRSARFAAEFLKQHGASDSLIHDVKRLITHHEDGGTADENLVMDADSVSFFETQVPHFLANIPERWSKEVVRQKIEYQFNRISSPEAKKIAKSLYEKALSALEKHGR